MGIASTAYSNRPFKNPGPCGAVRIHPYRKPALKMPVFEVPPLTECPPPVHNCHSRPPSSGRVCAHMGTAIQSSVATTLHHRFIFSPPCRLDLSEYPTIQEWDDSVQTCR